MEGCIDGWMDGWMDAWMHGWMHGCMDGWMHGDTGLTLIHTAFGVLVLCICDRVSHVTLARLKHKTRKA